jgi:hypothetical protein
MPLTKIQIESKIDSFVKKNNRKLISAVKVNELLHDILDASFNDGSGAAEDTHLFSENKTLAANRSHDMNGFSMTFLKSKVEFRASNGDGGLKALWVRNHLDNGDLFDVRNNGNITHNGSIVQNNATGNQSFLTNITSNFTTGFEARMFGSGGNGFLVQRLGGSSAVGINFTGSKGGYGMAMMGMFGQYNVDGSVYSYDTDTYTQYAADVVAGNSAPHFRTENGSLINLAQETTAVASSTFVSNSGTAINDASTFDGYTIAQAFKTLRNRGLLA